MTHAIRFRREDIESKLEVSDDGIIFEVAAPAPEVGITADDISLIQRGLLGLHDEIEKHVKPTKTFRFLPGANKPHPFAGHGSARMEHITRLMQKLDNIKP